MRSMLEQYENTDINVIAYFHHIGHIDKDTLSILLTTVKHSEDILTEHTWIPYQEEFKQLTLHKGDLLAFKATVTKYKKKDKTEDYGFNNLKNIRVIYKSTKYTGIEDIAHFSFKIKQEKKVYTQIKGDKRLFKHEYTINVHKGVSIDPGDKIEVELLYIHQDGEFEYAWKLDKEGRWNKGAIFNPEKYGQALILTAFYKVYLPDYHYKKLKELYFNILYTNSNIQLPYTYQTKLYTEPAKLKYDLFVGYNSKGNRIHDTKILKEREYIIDNIEQITNSLTIEELFKIIRRSFKSEDLIIIYNNKYASYYKDDNYLRKQTINKFWAAENPIRRKFIDSLHETLLNKQYTYVNIQKEDETMINSSDRPSPNTGMIRKGIDKIKEGNTNASITMSRKNVIIARAIDKMKDNHNKILGYRLQDFNGNVVDVASDILKQAIKNGEITVSNLTLTSDNRLVEHAEEDLTSLVNFKDKNIDSINITEVADAIAFMDNLFLDGVNTSIEEYVKSRNSIVSGLSHYYGELIDYNSNIAYKDMAYLYNKSVEIYKAILKHIPDANDKFDYLYLWFYTKTLPNVLNKLSDTQLSRLAAKSYLLHVYISKQVELNNLPEKYLLESNNLRKLIKSIDAPTIIKARKIGNTYIKYLNPDLFDFRYGEEAKGYTVVEMNEKTEILKQYDYICPAVVNISNYNKESNNIYGYLIGFHKNVTNRTITASIHLYTGTRSFDYKTVGSSITDITIKANEQIDTIANTLAELLNSYAKKLIQKAQ